MNKNWLVSHYYVSPGGFYYTIMLISLYSMQADDMVLIVASVE